MHAPMCLPLYQFDGLPANTMLTKHRNSPKRIDKRRRYVYTRVLYSVEANKPEARGIVQDWTRIRMPCLLDAGR